MLLLISLFSFVFAWMSEIPIPTPTPKNVSCAVVKCEKENEKITFLREEDEKELYSCKNVKAIEPETGEPKNTTILLIIIYIYININE